MGKGDSIHCLLVDSVLLQEFHQHLLPYFSDRPAPSPLQVNKKSQEVYSDRNQKLLG